MEKVLVFTVKDIDDEVAETSVIKVLNMLRTESYVKDSGEVIEPGETFRGVQGYTVVDLADGIKEDSRSVVRAFEALFALVASPVSYYTIRTWVVPTVEEARHGLNDLIAGAS